MMSTEMLVSGAIIVALLYLCLLQHLETRRLRRKIQWLRERDERLVRRHRVYEDRLAEMAARTWGEEPHSWGRYPVKPEPCEGKRGVGEKAQFQNLPRGETYEGKLWGGYE
jgi:hypothetical protein